MDNPVLMSYSDDQKAIFLEKAHFQKDLAPLIRPFNNFRAYFYFKKDQQYGAARKRHFYGNEHRCTYNQCLHQKVPDIVLNRLFGYDSLVQLVEKTFKGQWLNAKIFARVPGTNDFDVLCREYNKGKLLTDFVNDPIFDHENNEYEISQVSETMPARQYIIPLQIKLYYHIDRGRLVITENPVHSINQ